MARARRLLPLNTFEPRPKGQSLAIATASSSVLKLTTAQAGESTQARRDNSGGVSWQVTLSHG
jgi:hypothetical protein